MGRLGVGGGADWSVGVFIFVGLRARAGLRLSEMRAKKQRMAAAAGEEALHRVGFYNVGRKIGCGSFSVVKLATHRVTKSQVDGRSLLPWKSFENIYKKPIFRRIFTPPARAIIQVFSRDL